MSYIDYKKAKKGYWRWKTQAPCAWTEAYFQDIDSELILVKSVGTYGDAAAISKSEIEIKYEGGNTP